MYFIRELGIIAPINAKEYGRSSYSFFEMKNEIHHYVKNDFLKRKQTLIKHFYFGDLCYVFNSVNWTKICDEMLDSDDASKVQFDGKVAELAYTQNGDGVYHCSSKSTNLCHQLMVDSGTIGFAALEDLDISKDEIIERKLGAIIEIDLSNGLPRLVVETNNARTWFKVYHEIRIVQGRDVLAYVVTAEPEDELDDDFDDCYDED